MIKTGKIADRRLDRRGWLVGQFFDEGDPFRSTEVEIYSKLHLVGGGDELHVHPIGNEFMFVMSGRLKIRIGDEILELVGGDYVAIPGGTPDQILEIIEETVLVGVRVPSIKNNKILLNKETIKKTD